VRIDDIGCFAFVPDENGNPASFVSAPDADHSVRTSSGNVKLICHMDIPPGQEPAKATHAEGFLCGIANGFILTTDSKITASPGGRLVLTCQYHPDPNP
jgi:hypothetical protein